MSNISELTKNFIFDQEEIQFINQLISASKELHNTNKLQAEIKLNHSLIMLLAEKLKTVTIHKDDYDFLDKIIKKVSE